MGNFSSRNENSTLTFVKVEQPELQPSKFEPYAVLPVNAGLVLEIHTEPAALVIRKNGAAVEVEPGELMKLAGMLTVAAGGLPELMESNGILWEK